LKADEVNRNSLDELVKDGKNGRVFKTADELADQLVVRFYAPSLPYCPS
jgi:hypothetical protein